MKTKNLLLSVVVAACLITPAFLTAAPRAPGWPPLPEMARVTWSEAFDELYHAGVSNAVVELPTLGTLRESWSGYGLERAGAVTPFVITGLGETGQVQVTTDQGALRFWFSPHWSSGSGPGKVVPLVELAAVAGPKSAALWSLQVSADGTAVRWVGPAEKELLVTAEIDWAAGSWHQVILNYGTDGTELVLDGEVVARGAATLRVPAEVARLVIGSTLTGELAADGEFDEVYSFARPLRLAFHYLSLAGVAAEGPISEAELAYRQDVLAKRVATKAQKAEESEEASGGAQMLRVLGPTSECVTNSPLYITNLSVVFITNQGWTVQFEIQGTNGPADIFATANLVSPLTNASWVWLERGPSCAIYEYTNQAASRTFYLLGTKNDTDADGLTDAYEKLVSHTAPNNPDTDGDGMPDGWEVQNGLNPLANDASDDPDGDWLTNLQEYNGGTNSSNPKDLMVVAWGDNTDGQCNVPLKLRNVKAIAAGDDFSLALLNDGTVRAWGDNTYGQTDVPADLTNAVAIYASFRHAIALRADGRISLWGVWWHGTDYSLYQTADLTNVAFLAAGANHDLAVRSNGTLTAWSTFGSTPYTTIPSNIVSPTALAAGYSHSAAVSANGLVTAWGENIAGAGWNVTNVPVGLSNVVQLAAGDYHTLALKADGKVTAWGAGAGDGVLFEYGQSVVPAGLSNVTAIAAAGYHSIALRKDGAVISWGNLASPSFVQSNITAIATGRGHGLGIRSGRQLPLLLQEPVSQVELPGTNVTFTCLGLGLAGVHYQWQFNGVNLTGQTNATLTLTNIASGNVGDYTVMVATGAGSVTSSVATLALVGPPLITGTLPATPGTNWLTNGVSAPFQLSVQASALGTQRYPLRYQWFTNGSPILGETNQYLNLFPPWVPLWQTNPADGDYSVQVWNPVGTNAAGPWTMRVVSLPKPGSTVAWGNNSDGQIEYPVDLTNTLAISAGEYHSVAVREDGGLEYWGYTWATLPNDLTNLVSVSAGYAHTLALRADGTVRAWGQTNTYANTVPTNNYGIRNISAGTYHNLAVLTNGTVLAWGLNLPGVWNLTDVPLGVTNVTAVAAGTYHSLALKTDGTVVSWGYNDSGQTNVPGGLTNIVAVAAGERFSLALKENGTIRAWGDDSYGQTNVPVGLSNVMAIAAGRAHGVALRNDGTVVCWGDNSEGQTNAPSLLSNVKLIAAGGDHTLAGVFSTFVQYPVDVTKDLLLIYNTNSAASTWVKDYYLARRPMVSGANVLGVNYATNEWPQYLGRGITSDINFTNQVLLPYLNWLNTHPTKRPQYLIWFYDLPVEVFDGTNVYASPSYYLHTATPALQPFVTCINLRTTNDCKAYIDKLEYFGTNYAPGQLFISASHGGYRNTNFVLDGIRKGGPAPFYDDYSGDSNIVGTAYGTLLAAGVATNAVFYYDGLEIATNGILQTVTHPTSQTNLAGYICWGAHSSLGGNYATNGAVEWSGDSRWWIIETIESYNGQRDNPNTGQSSFLHWFSPNAFGGTNYSNTPVGAVTHVDEPNLPGVNNVSTYFKLWFGGKVFPSCAWNSRNTPYFQAVGDPFVRK